MVANVSLIDVSAVEQLRLIDPLVVGHGPTDTNCGFAVCVIGCTTIREEQGCNHIKFWHTVSEACNVIVVHMPIATFAKTLVRLARRLCPYQGAIGGKTRKVLLQLLFQALAATHQRNKHEHAPEDAEARQERARLVTCQRVKYFSVCI